MEMKVFYPELHRNLQKDRMNPGSRIICFVNTQHLYFHKLLIILPTSKDLQTRISIINLANRRKRNDAGKNILN